MHMHRPRGSFLWFDVLWGLAMEETKEEKEEGSEAQKPRSLPPPTASLLSSFLFSLSSFHPLGHFVRGKATNQMRALELEWILRRWASGGPPAEGSYESLL